MKTKDKSQRSLYLKRDIKKGQRIKFQDLISLRPSVGIKSYDYEKVIKKNVVKNIKKNQVLNWRLFN